MRRTLLSACVVLGCLLGSLWAEQTPGKVDINTASLAELDTLPGIGPAIAARIIDFRTRNGPFRRSEDILNVRGIGEKKFLKLKGRITISLAESSPGRPRPVGTAAKPPRPASPRRK